MAMKEGPEGLEENPAIIPATLQEIAPGEADNPVAPHGFTEEEAEELRSRAEDLVNELQAASGGRELELIDSVTSVGIQAQRRAKSELDLLRGRVGDMIAQEGTVAEVSKDLINLRLALNEINPHDLSQTGLGEAAILHGPGGRQIHSKLSGAGKDRHPVRAGFPTNWRD